MQKQPLARIRFIGKVLLFTLALLPLGPRCFAQALPTGEGDAVSAVNRQPGPMDAHELEAFLEPIVSQHMYDLHIPGAVFVLVKDGIIFFSKGYGFADLEKQIPVSPERTLFRVASIAKPFTATAVMQLLEQGRFRLGEDVNQYLPLFQLKNNFPKPVTLHHLLTHTGGFDERYLSGYAETEAEMEPLGPHLAGRMPDRVMPPGEVLSYSNYGMALAGYLVEETSRRSFAQYVDQEILAPLGMRRSTFRQPPPPPLAGDLAMSYRYRNGRYDPQPFIYTKAVPAGALSATAEDIAHFMIAHLQKGRYGEARILKEATVEAMHRTQFTHHPRMPGMAYGFAEYVTNHQRSLLGSGDFQSFTSLLFLLPEQDLGFFISSNNPPAKLKLDVLKAFMDHYYPVAEKLSPPPPMADYQKRARRFAGRYRTNRYTRHEIGKVTVLSGELPVTVHADGTLALLGTSWVEVEPLLFRALDKDEYITFRADDRGGIRHLCTWGGVYDRLDWYETTVFHVSLGGFFVLTFLSTVAWLGPLIRRWRKPPAPAAPARRWARILAAVASLLNLVFLTVVALSWWLTIARGGMLIKVPGWLKASFCIPLLSTVLTAGVLGFSVLAWKKKYWSVSGRWHYSLVAVGLIGFILFLHYWNLLGFSY
jgi:CubicO group peptidase (beta-lactamase class C family)